MDEPHGLGVCWAVGACKLDGDDVDGAGCSGWLYCVDDGARAPKRDRSGVAVRKLAWLLMVGRDAVVVTLVGSCEDHEKDGGVLGVLHVVLTGDVTEAASSQLGKPPLVVFDDAGTIPPLLALPLTSASKSPSLPPVPLPLSNAVPVTPPKARKSSLEPAVPALACPDSSCSFLVCSSSTRRESFLMSSMNVWNCFRSSNGPRLMLHRIGSISMATKSASADSPTMRRTLSAANMTAGSFVLMALTRGTILSCMVYLSSALDEDVFFLFSTRPLSPSSADAVSVEPPHRMTKACRPRTLMARLFVRLKTVATTGKSSFLMVLKSRTGRMDGSVRSAASTMECVGHSTAARTTGRISDKVLMREDCDETGIVYGDFLVVGGGLQRG